ncbi:hypothetical protein [Burkholderia multivorans]|uniref:hypothetical protein n=1 Tax=Burkholderia multivorans TaxID=87883 RepID=UPI000CFF16AD|nr:hypothetical protein [Burkholderia multivorans]PRG29268.1 hypothetical protein C6T62_24270 [Burkholderia multivorans]
MFKDDFDRFVELLDAAYSLHGKALPATAKALFFRSLAPYSLSAVRAAIDAHVKDPQRGQFPPKPADLIAQIEGAASNDTRPGAEEAWAIAVQALDEANTVMLTDEIAEAFGIAKPIFDLGDEVGARMAFREAYMRLLAQARANGTPVRWWPSIGTDVEKRHIALEKAVSQGLLPAASRVVQGALPAPAGLAPLLAAPATTVDAREALDSLRKFLERDSAESERKRHERVQREREATEARKAALRKQAESLGLSDAVEAAQPQ